MDEARENILSIFQKEIVNFWNQLLCLRNILLDIKQNRVIPDSSHRSTMGYHYDSYSVICYDDTQEWDYETNLSYSCDYDNSVTSDSA